MSSLKANTLRSIVFYVLLFAMYLLFVQERALPQVSDFENYANKGRDLANGHAIPEFYMFLQSPLAVATQALLYLLFSQKAIMAFQILSIGIVLLMLWFYSKYHRNAPLRMKIVPLLVLVTLPSLLSLMPYVNSDILMAPFFILGNYLLFRLFQKWMEKGGLQFREMLLPALVFAISQATRPVAFYYMVFLFIGFFCWQLKRNFSTIKTLIFWRENSSRLVIFFAIFIVSASTIYSVFGYGFRMQPRGDGMWSLYVGANTKSVGVYNAEDDATLKYAISTAPKDGLTQHLKDTFKQLAVERIKQNGWTHVKLIPYRAFKLMNPYYVSNFVLLGNKPINGFYKVMFFLSTCGVFLIYLVNGIAFLMLLFRKQMSNANMVFIVALFAAYAYTFVHVALLEIQPRYYCHLVLLQIFLAPMGLTEILNRKGRKDLTQSSLRF